MRDGATPRGGFRSRRSPPTPIVWHTDDDEGDLFAEAGDIPPPREGAKPLMVPRRFVDLAQLAVCHSDPARFSLLYRLLNRMQSEPGLIERTTDDDVFRLESMAKSVRRDRHKMTAFVRFKEV